MCLAQAQQRSDAGEARTCALRSQVKHSTTEPLRSLNFVRKLKKRIHEKLVLIVLRPTNAQANLRIRGCDHCSHKVKTRGNVKGEIDISNAYGIWK